MSLDEVKQHPIFSVNPSDLISYVYKYVNISTNNGQSYSGYVYTIDPVSQNCVLISLSEDNEFSDEQMKIISGHNISSILVLDEGTQFYKDKLDSLFRNSEVSTNILEDDLHKKLLKIKSWLIKNRIPVALSEFDSRILTISEALYIEPPYGLENCISTNEVVLARIQSLLKNMPNDFHS